MNVLDTAFPMEQFRRSGWPQATVSFVQSQHLLEEYDWHYTDTVNIGASELFLPAEQLSWYVDAQRHFYVVFVHKLQGVEVPLSPYSAPHSRCPGVSILPTIAPLELLTLCVQCFPHSFLYVLLIASRPVFVVSLMVHLHVL